MNTTRHFMGIGKIPVLANGTNAFVFITTEIGMVFAEVYAETRGFDRLLGDLGNNHFRNCSFVFHSMKCYSM